ncbi:hypothetical protein RB195_004876 [Necator americanus]|uniref:Uncharacterized protein n=1 Tax=Necator americanus TaxID=51031 RepID=A0ABR1BNG9_NECAM
MPVKKDHSDRRLSNATMESREELYDRSYPDMQKGDAVQHTAQPKPNPVNAKPHKDVVGSKRHEARTVAQAAALEPVRWSTAIGIVLHRAASSPAASAAARGSCRFDPTICKEMQQRRMDSV